MTACKDCVSEGVTTKRKPALTRNGNPVPGNRCATHHRAKNSARREADWELRLIKTYGITPEEYWAIYEFQGRRCYICQRATGTGRKRLSVDHCHTNGWVRGLLCGPCNVRVLGHLRDDPDALIRGASYLIQPPAFRAIGTRIVPDMREAA